MANPPDNKDNDKSVKSDRNLARPAGVSPPPLPTPDKSTQPTAADNNRTPSTANLAAGNAKANGNSSPDKSTPKSTPAQSEVPGKTEVKSASGSIANTRPPVGSAPATTTTRATAPSAASPSPANRQIKPPPVPAAGKTDSGNKSAPADASAPPVRRSRLERPIEPTRAPAAAAPTRQRPSRPLTRTQGETTSPARTELPPRRPAEPVSRTASTTRTPEGSLPRRPESTAGRTEYRATRQSEPARSITRPAAKSESTTRTSATRAPMAERPAGATSALPPPVSKQDPVIAVPGQPELSAQDADKPVAVPSDAAKPQRNIKTDPDTGRRLTRPVGPPHGHPDRRHMEPVVAKGTYIPPQGGRPADRHMERGDRTFAGPAAARRPAGRPRRRMKPPVGANPVGRFLNRPAPVAAPLDPAATSSGSSWGPLLLGLLLLCAVGWLAVDHYTPNIQEDLLQRSRASLDNAGLADSADVTIDGRNITLVGNVQNQQQSDLAEEAVSKTFGVRSVTNDLTIGDSPVAVATAGRKAPSFSVSTTADGITLAGAVSDQKFSDALNNAAIEQFGDSSVTNDLQIDADATNPGWAAAVGTLMPELNTIDNGALSIADGTMTISGTADNAESKAAIEEKANSLLGTQLNIVNQIEAPEPSAPSLPAFASVSETQSEVTLNGFMSAEGAASIAQAYESTGKAVINNISVNELAETPQWASNFTGALDAMQGVSDGKLTIARSGNLKLQGTVETDEQKDLIGQQVAELFGENTQISNEIAVVAPPVVPTLTPFASVRQNADSISVSGLLPPDAAEQLLRGLAPSGKTVADNITVDERVIQPEWVDALGKSVERMASIDNSSINIASNGTLTLKGDAKTEQTKQFTSISLRTLFGNTVNVQNDIAVAPVVPPPVVPDMTPFISVQQSPESITLRGLLPVQSAEEIVKALSGDGRKVINNATTDERVMQPEWASVLPEALERLGSVDNAGINIASDGTLSLTGEAETQQAKQFTAINIGTLFGNSVSLRNDINVKTPTIPEPPKPDILSLLGELDLSSIRFRTNSAELNDDSLEVLNQVVEVLNLSDEARVLIAGHTDSRGNTDYNFSLSAERANAVQQYLINRGIPAERLTAQGYGPTQPIASNDTATGRALNRRIEIQLIGE